MTKTRKKKSHGHCGSHGHKTPTYYTWEKMKERCYNSKHLRFSFYGGRGVKVALRWHKFENFLKDMGVRPENKTLDRKNVNGHYCKRNCRWATWQQQNLNKLRHFVPYFMEDEPPPVICGCGVDDKPCVMHPEAYGETIPF